MSSHEAQVEVGARSETGYVRKENQDRMSGSRVPLGHLYIVADGMGGHKGGAFAADLTVYGLQLHVDKAPADSSVKEVIQAAFKDTNEIVYRRAHSGDPTIEGMGSTAVLLLISGRVARVAHVGDSRAYLYRKGRLKQLTTDHTIVQKMVQAGMLKPKEAVDHPNSNVLDRAIGNKPSVEVDISNELPLNDGDAILLCSDGLSGYIADPEIKSVLRSQAAVQEIPDRLVELALQKGGKDNVTVQFIQYGTRKEAQSIKAKALGRRNSVSAPKPWRPLSQAAAAFVLGAAISAAVFYGYLQGLESDFRKSESALRTELDNKKESLGKAENELANTSTWLNQVQKELDDIKAKDAEGQVTQLKKKLNEGKKAGKQLQQQFDTSKKVADIKIGELEKELKTAKDQIKSLIKAEGVKLIILAEKLPDDPFFNMVSDAGSLEIKWVTPQQWPALPVNALPGTSKIYYTEDVKAAKIAKLSEHLGKLDSAGYGAENEQLKSAVKERFGEEHILVVLRSNMASEPEKTTESN